MKQEHDVPRKRVQTAHVRKLSRDSSVQVTHPAEQRDLARPERAFVICEIAGCFHLVAGRRWCNKHYQRWVKWGDPLKTLTVRRDVS
jgi:hypothetical protein